MVCRESPGSIVGQPFDFDAEQLLEVAGSFGIVLVDELLTREWHNSFMAKSRSSPRPPEEKTRRRARRTPVPVIGTLQNGIQHQCACLVEAVKRPASRDFLRAAPRVACSARASLSFRPFGLG